MAAITLQECIIEAESQLSDITSPTGDSDVSSFTTSIASSIKDYVYENGRRYHGFREARMDMLHHIYRLMLGGGLYKAPTPQSPQCILDIGTGTGIYAIDIADEFPNAEILGIDLSPIQPHRVPPNCKFVVDIVEAEWEFRVWFYSPEGELSDESYVRQWNRHLVDGMNIFGKSINIVPVGPWPKDPRLKELGRWMQIQTMDAIEPLSLALFTRVLGWSEQESRILFSKARQGFKETKRQLYVYTHFIYGRKPKA
ncbi:S-adenosyl-L-methionine-dependent methyltransferase [Aspergillus minisclerotigenes]|uniref:S-adenosyl-L-methionine-dependent methyltransferase n=1 Tax=Aspergillus minisclerotigenes TaxID=656917 RepID=A0A5N6JJN7_9EURO|nr:S-adenosyl-L-methionine-dependent methyltransferase [Aspergillus minisclerotigenes]